MKPEPPTNPGSPYVRPAGAAGAAESRPPSRTLASAVAVLGLLGLASPARAQETTDSNRVSYASFRLIAERNIFNASRSGRTPSPSREPRRTPRVDAFGLVGTLRYDKGPVAFFDGSASEFRKALRPGGSLAGYTVTEIGNDSVKLERDGKTTELSVGSQLKREDDGEWQVGEAGASFASTNSGAHEPGTAGGERPGAASTPASAGGGGGGAGGEMSDVLKRLMQKREQEMK